MRLGTQRLLVVLFPLLLSLPFVNRAYFVDDNYFVEIADWLKDHPGRPYDFRTDDAGLQNPGWERDGLVRMVNPLLHHYYLALLLKVGPRAEWFLRLGCLILVAASGFFLFELARRWTRHALLASWIVQASPAHWLTAHSLLIDSTLLVFFLAALWCFVVAEECESLGWAAASGVLGGAAILTKYPGVLLLPVLGAYVWTRGWSRPSAVRLAVASGLGIAALVAYSAWTAALYGAPHVLAASGRMVRAFGWAKPVVFFVFFSGATILPLLAWRALRFRTALYFALAGSLAAFFFATPMGGFTRAPALLLGLWLATSGAFLASSSALWRRPDHSSDRFLILWIAGFIAMMYVVMGWVAGRYFLLAVPALGFAVTRLAERKAAARAKTWLSVLLAAELAVGGAMAYADYRQADASRRIGADLAARGYSGGPGRYFLGDAFTVSYLRERGWIPAFPSTEFETGDLLLVKEITMPQWWVLGRGLPLRKKDVFEYPTVFPLKVMDYHGSAGFYASLWGALPFTLSNSPWERFLLVEVQPGDRPASSGAP